MIKQRETERTVRVGFIGAGQMARTHLEALQRIGVASVVVGVHDPLSSRAERVCPSRADRGLCFGASPDR